MFSYWKNLVIAAAAALLVGSSDAGAVTFNLVTNGGTGGGTNTAGAPGTFNLTLVSNDNDNDLTTAWTAVADQGYNVSFAWNYFTTDEDGSTFDAFGYFIGSTFTQLSLDGQGQGSTQAGAANFLVAAGQSFGFYISNFVGGVGPAFARLRGTLEPAVVPVPAAGLLLLGALSALGFAARRRRIVA